MKFALPISIRILLMPTISFVGKTSKKTVSDCPEIINGSKPVDGGNLLLNENEKNELLKLEPAAAEWIKPYSMGNEFINGIPRFCLWLKHCPPEKLRKMPLVLERIEAVRKMRLASKKIPTQKSAAHAQHCLGKSDNLKLHIWQCRRVSSEKRIYVPIGYLPPDHICRQYVICTCQTQRLYEFGVMTSLMHMAWMRVCAAD